MRPQMGEVEGGRPGNLRNPLQVPQLPLLELGLQLWAQHRLQKSLAEAVFCPQLGQNVVWGTFGAGKQESASRI